MANIPNVNVDKIKDLAKEQGMTMKYFSDHFGKHRGFLANVRRGKDYIDENELKFIAEKLNTTPEYLTDQTEIKERQSNNSDWRNDDEKELLGWIATLDTVKVTRLLEIAHLIELPDRDYDKISEVIRLFLDQDKQP